MDAVFMLLGRHERGIHVVRFGTDGVRVTKVRFLGWRLCWREMERRQRRRW
jgi:hypothetical protein